MKIILVEDRVSFQEVIKIVVEKIPSAALTIFSIAAEAITAINSEYKDFNVLMLDGDLGCGGSGDEILNILSEDQIRRTIVCSGNDDFIVEAKLKGVTVFIDKGFSGIRASQIDAYIREKIKSIQ